MPTKDPDKRRAADRARQRRHRSTPTTNGSQRPGGRDSERKASRRGLDPAAVLVRLAAELDALDAADPPLDPAMRARTVARVCAVALAAYRQAPGDDDERWDYGDLTNRELATLRRLSGKVRRMDA